MIDWERVVRASIHPVKVSILEILAMDGGRALSVNELRQELELPLSWVAYNTSVLHEQRILKLVEIRGSEHFYRLAGVVR